MQNSRKENFPSYLKEDSRLSIVADMRAADVLLKFYRDKCKTLENRIQDVKSIYILHTAKFREMITELQSELDSMREHQE